MFWAEGQDLLMNCIKQDWSKGNTELKCDSRIFSLVLTFTKMGKIARRVELEGEIIHSFVAVFIF